MKNITCDSIGKAWIESCRYIFNHGEIMKDGDKGIREIMHFFLSVTHPDQEDVLIQKYGDSAMIQWMLSNFLEQKRVPELNNGLSYGTRLFNYHGKNQVDWVIEKLQKKPEAKSVIIPMLMPNDDTDYIPCVSMLDFKIRNNKLMITAMCRAIDFGNKVYANLLAIHKVQRIVTDKLGIECGELCFYVVSAHLYADDYKKIEGILHDINAS